MVKKIGITLLGLASVSMTASAVEIPDSINGLELGEVVVSGNSARQRLDNARFGAERLELSKLLQLPTLGGENDIIKTIALLPGVRSENDGGGGFEVRGGNASQNLTIVDGITLYNPSHVMGIFSTFNDNAISGATLYKGPIPAMYGDATSSVLETSLAPGDMTDYHGSATIGILAAKIKAEGPIVKDRLSMAVTARRSYVDAFLKMIPKYKSTVMNFYDITAKIRFTPSAAHLLDASFIMSRDNMAVGDLMGMHWGNLGASLNWLARASGPVNFTTTASLTRYTPRMAMDILAVDQEMRTYIHNYSLNERIRWQISDTHHLEAGFRSALFKVKSAEWTISDVREKEIRSLWENSVWTDWSGRFFDRLDVTAGVRLNVSSVLTGKRFSDFKSVLGEPHARGAKTYVEAEPRVNLKYDLTSLHSIKAAFGISSQNLHAIRSSATSFPFDRYALVSKTVKPERARQYGLGYTGMTTSGSYDWSAEIYRRDIDNVYDFVDGRGPFSDIDLEKIILGGKGRSYGLEIMARKNSGRLTGWVSYTLSRTQTKIPGINSGQWYNATNDRRNDFSVTAIYKLTDRWTLSGSWIYMSGQPLTAPDVKYEIGGETCYYYSRRNAYMTPATHRLDLGATYRHVGKKFTYEWSFGIYNAYCHYNPYVVYFEDDDTKPSGTRAVQYSMYGLIPSVSYTLRF